MEMNGKQKRYLRSLAVNIKPIVQIGKSGLSNEILTSIRNAADARELIKQMWQKQLKKWDLMLFKSSVEISLCLKFLTAKKIAKFRLKLKIL